MSTEDDADKEGQRRPALLHGAPQAPPRQPKPGLETWRLRHPDGRIQRCELRDDSMAGAGWDVMQLENGEPLFSRRCGNEQIAVRGRGRQEGSVTNRLGGESHRNRLRSTEIMMVVAPSSSVEERRILRELQKKLKVLNDDIQRLTRLGDAESLRLMREQLNTRDQVQTAYNELRERIDRRLG